MTYTHTSLVFGSVLLIASSCGKPTDSTVASDSSSLQMDTLIAVDDDIPMSDIIDYYGALDTDIEMSLATFTPLEEVLATARTAIYFKDSLQRLRPELTDPSDSALFRPTSTRAYDAIIAYQNRMRSGIKLDDQVPRLIDVVRTPGESDRSAEFLPTAQNSTYLSNGNFFLMGGAPFISELEGTFEGPDGNAEIRFGTSNTENANYLFNSVYHRFQVAAEITFGPGLDSYDGGPREVNGIGSLTHTFSERIPVYFITPAGPVKGRLASVRIKLVPQGMGCISDEPYYEFASPEDISANDILAVYIPYADTSIDRMTVDRVNRAVWTADLNGDGLADLASVSGIFEGISSDMMNEVLWFVNIGGEWKLIDAGSDPDCT